MIKDLLVKEHEIKEEEFDPEDANENSENWSKTMKQAGVKNGDFINFIWKPLDI